MDAPQTATIHSGLLRCAGACPQLIESPVTTRNARAVLIVQALPPASRPLGPGGQKVKKTQSSHADLRSISDQGYHTLTTQAEVQSRDPGAVTALKA